MGCSLTRGVLHLFAAVICFGMVLSSHIALAKRGGETTIKDYYGLLLMAATYTKKPPAGQGIEVYSENPMYWQFNGEPTLLIGGFDQGEPFLMKKADLKRGLDQLASVGGNYLRNTMAYFPGTPVESYPFVRLPSGKFDLDQLNPIYWNYLKVLFEETSRRDIVVQLELWDPWYLRGNPWAEGPWAPLNNVNYTTGTGLPNTITEMPWVKLNPFYRAAIDADKAIVLQYQQAFVAKILEVAKPFNNVIYQIENEAAGPLWFSDYWARFIHDHAGKEVFVTHMPGTYDLLGDEHDHIINSPKTYGFMESSQGSMGGTSNDEHYEHFCAFVDKIEASAKPRPVNNVKIYKWVRSWGDQYKGGAHIAINRMWHDVFAGLGGVRFHKTGKAGIGLTAEAQRQIKSLRYFANRVSLPKMEPSTDGLYYRGSDEAYAMSEVDSGRAQAVYFTGEGDAEVALDLSAVAAAGPLELTWYNTDSGEVKPVVSVDVGGLLTLSAPTTDRWLAILQ